MKFKKDEVDKAHNMHKERRDVYKGKRPLGRPRHRWEVVTKINSRTVEYKFVK
jgi:hypothetical protein